MAKRYIDTDTAYEVLTEYYHHKTEAQHEALREALDRVPAADVVEVVRCKDCKHKYGYKCDYDDRPVGRGDYCSRGERMDEVTE